MQDIIIFGASKAGEEAYEFLKDRYNVIGFVDNDERKWGMEFCGIKVYSPKKCVEIKDCTVVIASMYVTEIG
ncbi:MAG: asparagine synthase, partial [Lachnospira sp.]|nr:asparagine synthase [Lachnospira sp.]MBQ4284443.1 asparagine synthase [Lachnospira sp.]